MTASNTFGRATVWALTNKSGGGVVAGDVVIIDTANNDAFTTTTSAATTAIVGIATGTIASNAVGLVLLQGYASLVNVNASVTRGHYGATHTVAKQAADAGATRTTGTFCQFLTGGTTPDALIFNPDLGGAALTNPMTTKGDIIYADTGGTPLRLGAGTAGYALTSSGAGNAPAYANVKAGATLQSVNRTAGNFTLSANVTTMTEVSSALRLTLAAATGDVLMVGLSSLLTQGGASEAILDSATIVTGAIVNQMSPGTKHVGHGYTGTALRDVGVSVLYVVQAGDISGGNVTVSLTYINADPAATGLLRAASDYALRYWVVNLGQ